jgi:DNA invertase Pin-like site-specific DNA recombinase
MATVFYARVSTSEQTIDHQVIQAKAAGFSFDHVVTDDGVSGVTTKLSDRAGGRRLFDLLRSGDTLVVRWVDRLGRNYEDVSDNIRDFMRRGVVIRTIINGMVFDGATKEPMAQAVRDALIGFMAALSKAQAEATKEAQRAGIAHAKAQVKKIYLGRKPSYSEDQISQVITMTGEGMGATAVANLLGLSRAAVYRIHKDPGNAHKCVRAWDSAKNAVAT